MEKDLMSLQNDYGNEFVCQNKLLQYGGSLGSALSQLFFEGTFAEGILEN